MSPRDYINLHHNLTTENIEVVEEPKWFKYTTHYNIGICVKLYGKTVKMLYKDGYYCAILNQGAELRHNSLPVLREVLRSILLGSYCCA